MSSIRLFVLSSFAELGPMHGHRLRIEAERNHVHLWTDITVGAVYGAMKRLATEGLLQATGREQHGNRPTRQLYEITDDGRRVLVDLRCSGLTQVWFKYDPFDLALTQTERNSLETLPSTLSSRLESLRTMLSETIAINDRAKPNVNIAKQWALRHTEYRLAAEISYLEDLLASVDGVVADERGGVHVRGAAEVSGRPTPGMKTD